MKLDPSLQHIANRVGEGSAYEIFHADDKMQRDAPELRISIKRKNAREPKTERKCPVSKKEVNRRRGSRVSVERDGDIPGQATIVEQREPEWNGVLDPLHPLPLNEPIKWTSVELKLPAGSVTGQFAAENSSMATSRSIAVEPAHQSPVDQIHTWLEDVRSALKGVSDLSELRTIRKDLQAALTSVEAKLAVECAETSGLITAPACLDGMDLSDGCATLQSDPQECMPPYHDLAVSSAAPLQEYPHVEWDRCINAFATFQGDLQVEDVSYTNDSPTFGPALPPGQSLPQQSATSKAFQAQSIYLRDTEFETYDEDDLPIDPSLLLQRANYHSRFDAEMAIEWSPQTAHEESPKPAFQQTEYISFSH